MTSPLVNTKILTLGKVPDDCHIRHFESPQILAIHLPASLHVFSEFRAGTADVFNLREQSLELFHLLCLEKRTLAFHATSWCQLLFSLQHQTGLTFYLVSSEDIQLENWK